jgi:hypothetical protein
MAAFGDYQRGRLKSFPCLMCLCMGSAAPPSRNRAQGIAADAAISWASTIWNFPGRRTTQLNYTKKLNQEQMLAGRQLNRNIPKTFILQLRYIEQLLER